MTFNSMPRFRPQPQNGGWGDMPKGATHRRANWIFYWTLTSPSSLCGLRFRDGQPAAVAKVRETMLAIGKKLAEANEPSQKDATPEGSTTKE